MKCPSFHISKKVDDSGYDSEKTTLSFYRFLLCHNLREKAQKIQTAEVLKEVKF